MVHAMDESENIRKLEAQFANNDRKVHETAQRACDEADNVVREVARKDATGKFKIPSGTMRRPKVDLPPSPTPANGTASH